MEGCRHGGVPFDRVEAPRMIERIKVGKMLDGSRGRVRADRERFADLPVRFGDFAVLNGDLVSEVDINPLIVTRMEPASEGGIDAQVCAVDRLIMLRAPS